MKEIVFLPAPQFSGLGPREEKSIFRKFLDTVTLGGTHKLQVGAEHQFGRKPVSTFLESFREYSEASIVGGILGALNGSGNIEPGGIPVDGAAAVVGFAGRIMTGADSGMGKTLGDIGMASTSVYWFRMGTRWAKARSGIHGEGEDGDDGYIPDHTDGSNYEDDPVVRAAQNL